MKQKTNYLLDYQYAIGLIIGLLYGWYAQENVIGIIVLVIILIIAERMFN